MSIVSYTVSNSNKGSTLCILIINIVACGTKNWAKNDGNTLTLVTGNV